MLNVFVVIEHGMRRLLHVNVTTNPSANWTLQQLREVVGDAETHSYIIHDRDSIFSKALDDSMKALGLKVLRTPVASPRANSICERVIGTIRRECLDFIIPMSEWHVRPILREWVGHYNRGRSHASLGHGIPEGSIVAPVVRESNGRSVPARCRVAATPILSGLHHEYRLERHAA